MVSVNFPETEIFVSSLFPIMVIVGFIKSIFDLLSTKNFISFVSKLIFTFSIIKSASRQEIALVLCSISSWDLNSVLPSSNLPHEK